MQVTVFHFQLDTDPRYRERIYLPRVYTIFSTSGISSIGGMRTISSESFMIEAECGGMQHPDLFQFDIIFEEADLCR